MQHADIARRPPIDDPQDGRVRQQIEQTIDQASLVDECAGRDRLSPPNTELDADPGPSAGTPGARDSTKARVPQELDFGVANSSPKQPRSRIRASVAAFRIVPGVSAVMNGRAVRVMDVCSHSKIQVRVEGTGELAWARPEELSAPVPLSDSARVLTHPHEADPAAESHAKAWCDALAELPLRPAVRQVDLVAVAMGVHRRTVIRRHALYLADPTPISQLNSSPGPAPGSKRLRPIVEAAVARAIQEVHLKRPETPITAVHKRVRQLCAEKGERSPSYKAVRRRVHAVDPMLTARKRLGVDRALAVQAPSVRGITTHRALEMVQIDHALVDMIVVCPETRLAIGRPWITLAIDVHTRCVVGYYLSMDSPTQTCVALCLAHACLPKGDWMRRLGIEHEYPMFGKFETVSWDNAKTFRAQGIQTQCERFGIHVHLRPVRKPHYGAFIERYIGNLMGKIHLLPGTTFSNPQKRSDYDSERHAVMSFKDLEAWIGQEIVGVYHHTEHRGLGGVTPFQKWQSSWITRGGQVELPTMIANPRQFLVGLLPRQLRAVTREGVALMGLKYWDPAIAQLINDGRRHYVHYHHGDLSKVYLAYQGDYIDIPLLDRSRPPFSVYELRDAKRSLKAQAAGRKSEEVLFEAMMQQRKIQDEAAVTTKWARRKRARRAESPVSAPPSSSVDYSLPVGRVNFDEADKV